MKTKGEAQAGGCHSSNGMVKTNKFSEIGALVACLQCLKARDHVNTEEVEYLLKLLKEFHHREKNEEIADRLKTITN